MSQLKVFYNGSDYVVATSSGEAEWCNKIRLGDTTDETGPLFVPVDPHYPIIIDVNNSGDICNENDEDYHGFRTMLAHEWVMSEAPKHNNEPFYLCSEDQ